MTGWQLESPCKIGSFNIRSLSNRKIPTLKSVIRNNGLDMMCLCETWHFPQCAAVTELLNEG